MKFECINIDTLISEKEYPDGMDLINNKIYDGELLVNSSNRGLDYVYLTPFGGIFLKKRFRVISFEEWREIQIMKIIDEVL